LGGATGGGGGPVDLGGGASGWRLLEQWLSAAHAVCVSTSVWLTCCEGEKGVGLVVQNIPALRGHRLGAGMLKGGSKPLD
jgi:hypothetical protein